MQEALRDYATARQAPERKPQPVRAALIRLGASFGAHGPDALSIVENAQDAEPDPGRRASLALELSLSDEAINASGGRSPAWSQSSADWNRYARLAASALLTARDYSMEAAASIQRRDIIAELVDLRADTDVLLRSDSYALWAPGIRDNSVGDWRTTVDATPAPTDLTLPLAYELECRKQLLQLALLDHRAERSDVRQHQLGIKLLARALDAERDVIVGPQDEGNDRLWLMSSRVPTIVGRNPEVWGVLTKARHELIGIGKGVLTDRNVQRWSEAVAVSWCSIPESATLVGTLPVDRLPHIVRSARDYDVRSLLKLVQREMEARASSSPRDPTLWAAIEQIAEVSPVDRSWVAKLLVERRKHVDRHPAIDAAEEWEAARLATDEFRSLVQSGVPQAALPALSIAHRRQLEALEEKNRRHIAAGAALVREQIARVERFAADVRSAIGTNPPDLGDIVARAVADLRSVLARVTSLAGEAERAPYQHTPAAEPLMEGTLVDALQNLEFDPRRTTTEAIELRRRARARLVDDVRLNPEAASEINARLGDLPPEAISLVWEAGITLRNEDLLRSVEHVIASQPWGRRVWQEVLVRYGDTDVSPVPVSDAVARATLTDLLAHIFANEESRQIDRDLARLNEESLATLNTLTNYVAGIVDRLHAATKRFTSEADFGSTTRN